MIPNAVLVQTEKKKVCELYWCCCCLFFVVVVVVVMMVMVVMVMTMVMVNRGGDVSGYDDGNTDAVVVYL